MTSGTMDDGAPDIIRRKRRSRCRKEEANAGFNPAEKKKGEWMATGIMDDGDAGYNPAEKKKGERMATGIMDDEDAG